MVALASASADLPVAFVEVRCGERKILLRPPRFEPATLDATGCDAGLTITTHFTTGDEALPNGSADRRSRAHSCRLRSD